MIRFFQNIFPENTFRKPSVLVIIFSCCFAFWFVDFWKPYNTAKKQTNFVWDVAQYYSYLPATFCNDGSYDFFPQLRQTFLPRGPKGTIMPKTTYGMSILYAPFFALGYKIAYNQQSPLNGFSEPFATCVHWGSIFYVMLGLVFLRKFLLAYFSELITALTLFCTLFGTMLFMYTYSQSEMSHGYLFMLFSLFLWLTQLWHKAQKLKYAVFLGISFSLIVLIRPTEIFICLFFILWDVRKPRDLILKFRLFLKNYRQFFVMFVLGFLIWLPQLIFWKNHAGTYLYFSYPGEGFFWNDPQIFNILFSYRKGWILYTPMVILSFIGFFFIKKEFPVSKWTFMFVTAGMVYVLSCWWDWWFGGCFGARGFCQDIAFLAIPLAFFLDFVFYSPKKFVLKGAVSLLTILFVFSCICQNIGQSYQYQTSHLHFCATSEKVYWDVFRTYQFQDIYSGQYWLDLKKTDYDKMRSGEDRDQ